MPSRTPLIDPASFFREHDTPYLSGIGVWLGHLIGSIVLTYLLIRLLLSNATNVPSGATSVLGDLMFASAIISIPIAFVALLVVAAVMHYWVRSEAQYPSFIAAIGVAGWSYAPELISLPINYAIARVQIAGRTFDAGDPQAFASELEALEAGLGISQFVIPLIVVAWSVYILTHGIAATHDVDAEETLTPALLIGLGSLVLHLVW